MNFPTLICHFLIGPPSSGKTTLAHQMSQIVSNSHIVSTDQIRQDLYGDEADQGIWAEIEAVALAQMRQAISKGQSVIYDATNAKRAWRMGLLQKLSGSEAQWVAWFLKTPQQQCKEWNLKRSRQVPAAIVDDSFRSLKQIPPLPAEGFLAVYELNPATSQDLIGEVANKIDNLSRSLINRANRTQHDQVIWHPYSRLLDFDRLIHLLSLLAQYPGIGNLQTTNPELLHEILGEESTFRTSVSEICAVILKHCGEVYADPEALFRDLEWLEINRFLEPTAAYQELVVFEVKEPVTSTHPYSDLEPFKRLLTTIRFILQHPLHLNSELGSLGSLVTAMQEQGLMVGDQTDAVRKDIERVLKPYKLLPDFSLKRGYFIGTGILSAVQLTRVFHILQSQAKNLQDPLALEIFEAFEERMRWSKLNIESIYPVRAICNRTIINTQLLPKSALAKNIDRLEEEIEQGRLLELNRFQGVGSYDERQTGFFRICPLQIVFHNIGWYLGYEITEGKNKGLLQFERLDRLFRGYPSSTRWERSAQLPSLQNLQRLYEACGGIYLGKSVKEQRDFLSSNRKLRETASTNIELWLNDHAFRFVSEGTQRFPTTQMRMSSRLANTPISEEKASIFTLANSSDPSFPNRFQVVLPCWSLDDIDLRRWILGFGSLVKVIEPPGLAEAIANTGKAIASLYDF